MSYLKKSQFQEVLTTVEKLQFEEQETLLEIIKKRLAERRRNEIYQNAQDTLKAVRDKKAKYGSVEDFKKDLLEP